MLSDTIAYIEEFTEGFRPEIGIVLGSGLGSFADEYTKYSIRYGFIPGFASSSVSGHQGNLVFGKIKGHKVVIMQGRIHYYEGYTMQDVTFPIKVMKELGVKTLILTNASGGINRTFKPGDFVAITDHINLMGSNPLIGPNNERMGPRFPDMSEVYNRNLIKLTDNAAKLLKINLKHGIYCATSGPSYETPAEIQMIRTLGGDVVGMSTVPEAIVANYCGMKVLGISCVTNYASGVSSKPLSHDEVIETAKKSREKFKDLLLLLLENIK